MRLRFLLVVLTLTLVMAFPLGHAAVPKDDATAKELKQLQGSWEAVYSMLDGKEDQSWKEEGRSVITFSGNKFVIKRKNKLREEGTMDSFDLTKTPKVFKHTILKKPSHPKMEGKTYPGIYLLADDLFIACVGETVPTKFSAPAGSKYLLVIYKRIKK